MTTNGQRFRSALLRIAGDRSRIPGLMTTLRPYFDMAADGRYAFGPADDRAIRLAIRVATDRRADRLVTLTTDRRAIDELELMSNGTSALAFLLDRRFGGPVDRELSPTFMDVLGRPLAAAFAASYRKRLIACYGEGFGQNLCTNLALNAGETLFLLTAAVLRGDDAARRALTPLARRLTSGIPLMLTTRGTGEWTVFRG